MSRLLHSYSRISLIAVLVASSLIQSSCSTSDADNTHAAKQDLAIGTETRVIAGIALESPIVITVASIQTDGGTLEVGFTDARGTHLFAFLDGSLARQMNPDEARKPPAVSVVAPASSPVPTRLKVGGADERELYRLLVACIDRATKDGDPLVRYDLGVYPNWKSDPDRDRRLVMMFKSALESSARSN